LRTKEQGTHLTLNEHDDDDIILFRQAIEHIALNGFEK
jgi:hypothetical protein